MLQDCHIRTLFNNKPRAALYIAVGINDFVFMGALHNCGSELFLEGCSTIER